MRVVWTSSATRAIWHAYDYIHNFNPRAAMHMAEALLTAGDSLIDFPYKGRLVPKTEMRELVSVHPYIIRYRIDGDIIVILRVRHSARRPTNP